jgi:neutral ceramidase
MYQAGWSKQEISVTPQGYAMHGFGMAQHRATAQRTPLHARALVLQDSKGKALAICCLDLGYVTWSMRAGIVARLSAELGASFDEAALVLTCTHTHSGPGGCAHEAMYNLVTPGFVPAHLEAVIVAASGAILAAWQDMAPTTLALAQGEFAEHLPVAWNRSIKAWNRNPDVRKYTFSQTQKAVNRRMDLLSLRRDGQLQALLSLFGVHATCLGSGLHSYDGDNKGYAARQVEQELADAGAAGPVAIFAQATAGDVSPYYHGPGDLKRRQKLVGEAEYAYAEQNGRRQSERALAIAGSGQEQELSGDIDAVLSYLDFTNIKADPQFANGETEAWTSEPCHGVAFFVGTPVDGLGIAKPLGKAISALAWAVKKYRLDHMDEFPPEEQAYLRRIYAAQGPKSILMEAGRKRVLGQDINGLKVPDFIDPAVAELKRQAGIGAISKSALVPTVLPLQIVRIGSLALVCCPGEFTTTAGRRVVEAVQQSLRGQGVEHVLICTYCNEYMGYVTTQEEYQEQAYEGGHTIFGQWTLAAFQTGFARLAAELGRAADKRGHDRTTRPEPVPTEELARRTAQAPRH